MRHLVLFSEMGPVGMHDLQEILSDPLQAATLAMSSDVNKIRIVFGDYGKKQIV